MCILSKKDSHAKPRRGFASHLLGVFGPLRDLFFVWLGIVFDAHDKKILSFIDFRDRSKEYSVEFSEKCFFIGQ